MKTRKSVVWKYFIVIDDSYVKCTICNKKYSRKGRTTTSLKGHLKSMHQEVYKEFHKLVEEQREAEKSDVKPSSSKKVIKEMETILKEAVKNTQFWDTSHVKAKEMDTLIGEMLAVQNVPFNFVDEVGFRRVMRAALPNYQLRNREFFTNYVCEKLYPKLCVKIETLLKKNIKLSFTSDVWTKPSANVSFLCLTAHGITEDLNRMQIVLKCFPFYGRYTDKDICEKFRIMLREWKISDEKVHCFIRYNGSSTGKAINLANFTDENCIIHQLQLCVYAALEYSEVKDLISKCKEIAMHFNDSQTAQEELHLIQTEQLDQPSRRVIEDCSNRWNSTFYMIERLINIKDSICLYANKYSIPQLSSKEWMDLNIMLRILNPFEEITRILSDTRTYISSVIPLINVLKQTLQLEKDKHDSSQIFNSIINKLIKEINSRFGELENDHLYALATYLDPKYKLKFFNEIIKTNIESELLRLLTLNNKLNDVELGNTIVEVEIENVESPVSKKPKIEPNTSTDDQLSTNLQVEMPQSIQSNLEKTLANDSDEIDKNHITFLLVVWKALINDYNKEKRRRPTGDPLLWWKTNTQFKAFIPIVRTFLSPPTCSISSEQRFSGAGLIDDLLNNRIERDEVAKLLFIKHNLPLLDFDY